MPRFDPFAGLRYDPDAVRLDQVIAPPYDVIESAERVHLANRSPYNAVLVELPETDLAGGRDRYQVAAGLLESWIVDGIVRTDPSEAFYAYTMTSPDGARSTGVLGALGLGEADDDDILPHEQTLPKAKSDRLDLLRATRANLSPIWGLSLAEGLSALIDTEGPAAAEAYDDDGVRHQLWVIEDPVSIEALRSAVASAPVVIADGHHRFETAKTYRSECGGADRGAESIMALVVELAEDQLTVGPIHRSLSGLPEGFDLPEALRKWFDVIRAGDLTERVVGALGDSQSLALLTADAAWMLTAHPELYEAAQADLDSALVSYALNELPTHTSTHRHSWRQAMDSVTSGEAQAALLLRPVSVAQIAEWARLRQKMPPKTTYFSPKPRTGMVFRLLDPVEGVVGQFESGIG
jgi:uncharacterized protein (DUF1015 family)